MSIFGTRPEAIKMAPVVRRLQREPSLTSLVCVTGQHREMLDQVLDLFEISPDRDLAVMEANQSLNGVLSRIVGALDDVFDELRPDRVLVHGDTATAMAATLAAFHRGVPVGHVEAGLRTYDLARPWPEEMNRRVVDLAADLLFAPTPGAKLNLEGEKLQGRVVVTGNTVIDALQMMVGRLDSDAGLCARVDAGLPGLAADRKLVLVTGHRRENFGDGFRSICAALAAIADRGDVEIVYPVHLNPNVQKPVFEAFAGRVNVHLLPPLDYLPFVRLMQRADVILTDSGGVQEEAPSLGKPVLVMRDVTERPEAVEAGAARLVGAETAGIVAATTKLLDDPRTVDAFAGVHNPYGDGVAADRIAAAITGSEFREFSPNSRPARDALQFA